MGQQPPQHVPPNPVPTTYGTGIVTADDGTKLIMVSFSHPAGPNVFFFGADHAEKFANQVKVMAQRARSGLIVPDNGQPIETNHLDKIVDIARKSREQ